MGGKIMPEDFPAIGRGMCVSVAAKHYKVCTRTIRNWAVDHGGGLHEAMIQNGRWGSRVGGAAGAKKLRETKPVEKSWHDPIDQRAMTHLQRTKRWVCYSSRIHGSIGKVYYNVGNRKLTFDELIAVARQNGFQD
jgi:hypothetical protein